VSFAAVLDRLAALENPYPGLRPFDTNDSHLFFGRDRQTAELAALLERNRFVAVVGVSGSGKSSLVRAGLIPALERGQIREARPHWRIVISTPGRTPFDNLAEQLREQRFEPAALQQSSHGLIEVAGQLGRDEALLVVVDQFEELFRYRDATPVTADAMERQAAASAQAAAFVQLLLAASGHHPPIYVVLTMRSDYLGDCAEFRDLPEALNRSQYLVPRLTRQERKEAIEYPLGPVAIAPGLVQQMLNDVGDEPEQLPILQHALMRTWTQWRRADPEQMRGIESRDYEAIGGFQNALNDHADELLKTLDEEIVDTLFKRLTARGLGNRERRDPAQLKELWALCGAHTDSERHAVNVVIDALRHGEATFLSPRFGPLSAETDIDITHESLIRLWRRLRDEWLPEEQKAAKTFLDLAARARTWRRGGPMLAGLDLSDALTWRAALNKSSAWAEHYADATALSETQAFIDASVAEERGRLRQRERRWWLAVAAAFVSLLIAIGFIALYADANSAKNAVLSAQLQGLVRQLTAHAFAQQAEGQPETALLLATEAFQRQRTPEDDRILRQLVATVPRPLVRIAHDKALRFVEFGASGSILISAAADGVIRAINASDGRDLWQAREDMNKSFAVSRDGAKVATGNLDSVVVVRDARSGRELWRRRLAGDFTAALLFSPNGRLLATVGYSQFAVLAADTGNELFRSAIASANSASHPASFSADSALIAINSSPAPVILDATTGTEIMRLPSGPATTNVEFNPGSPGLLASSDDNGFVRLFEARTGRPVWERNVGRTVRALAFSSDGRSLAASGFDSIARILDAGDGAETARIPLSDFARTLAFSGDGRWVASDSDDGSVRVFDSRTGRELWRIAHANSVGSVTFSPDARLLATGDEDGTVRIVELVRADEVFRFFVSKDENRGIGISRDAHRLALISRNNLQLREMPDGRITTSIPFRHTVTTSLVVSADGRWLAYDLEPLSVVSTQDGSEVLQIVFSPDGSRIATADGDAVVLHEIAPKGSKITLKVSNPDAMSFSADGRHIAIESRTKPGNESGKATSTAVLVFEVASGREAGRIPTSGDVEDIALNADGRLMAISEDKTLQVFQVATTKPVSVASQKGAHTMLSFSPDSSQIASSTANAVHVFEVSSGTETSRISEGWSELAGLVHEGGYVMTVAVFGSDDSGDIVASRHPTGRDDLLKEACSRLPRDLTADEWRLYAGSGIDYSPACKAYR